MISDAAFAKRGWRRLVPEANPPIEEEGEVIVTSALLRLIIGASAIMALFSLTSGCGGESQGGGDEHGAKAQLAPSGSKAVDEGETGQLKPMSWSVGAERRRALRLGVQTSHCGYREPVPFIERVERRHRHDGLVFTVYVRFGPKHLEPGGCVGVGLILGKWVRIGERAKSKPLFDGSTSPPSRRYLPPRFG